MRNNRESPVCVAHLKAENFVSETEMSPEEHGSQCQKLSVNAFDREQ